MKKVIDISTHVIIFLIIFILAVGICLQSELSPFSNTVPTVDSDVYIYISLLLHDGKTLYTDIFDHKGPLFHLIDYIGTSIPLPNYMGVWFLEVCFMTITLLFLFKTANIICKNKILSLLALSISIMPFSHFFINGNYPEEYSLPFIAISLYYLASYLNGLSDLSKKECVFIGICASCVCFIKANLVSVWVVFCSIIIIKMVISKQWIKIRDTILYFFIGFFMIFIPILIYLLIQGNLVDFIEQYIIFNLKYSSVSNGIESNVLNIFVTNTFYVSFVACITDIIIRFIKKQNGKLLSFTCLLYLIITLLIIIMPKNDFFHYGMVSIPTYIIPISLLLSDFLDVLYVRENILRIVLTSFIFIVFSFSFVRRDIAKYNKNILLVTADRFEFRETDITNRIKEISSDEDSLLVLGNECYIYLLAEKTCNCKYIYQIPIVRVDPSIADKTIQEIDTKKPNLIVLTKTSYVEIANAFYKYIEDNPVYELVEDYGYYELYKLN